MKKKGLLILLVLIALLGVGTYSYLYKGHRDIATETAAATLKAPQLQETFATDAATANSSYLNQTIVVTGTVTGIEGTTVTLNNSVLCNFTTLPANLETNTALAVKGRCIGYDELFEEVKLDQCSTN